MQTNKKSENCQNDSAATGLGLSLGAGIGVALGAEIGAALGNIAIGVAIGPALGVLLVRFNKEYLFGAPDKARN